MFFENVTVKEIGEELSLKFDELITMIMDLKDQGKDSRAIENQIQHMIYSLYEITDIEAKILEESESFFSSEPSIILRSSSLIS